MSNKQKAAILLIALGPDISSEIFKHLREDEMDKLTLEIANQSLFIGSAHNGRINGRNITAANNGPVT